MQEGTNDLQESPGLPSLQLGDEANPQGPDPNAQRNV